MPLPARFTILTAGVFFCPNRLAGRREQSECADFARSAMLP